jgi:hypothetical protein
VVSDHDNFQSYFFIGMISVPYAAMVTLRQLRYLEALAETHHFGHAAEGEQSHVTNIAGPAK